jgi:phosphoserine phosphatase
MDAVNRNVPLCVDCDGTLLRTDLLHEAVFLLLKSAPWKVLLLPLWLLKGKAYLKDRLAQAVSFSWGTLPLNDDVVALVREARSEGRIVVLATASHHSQAQGIARHLDLFDEVLASDAHVNLSGERKGHDLASRYGERGFDYVGNDQADLPVWSRARRGTVVSASKSLEDAARQVTDVERVIAPPRPRIRTYLKGLRVHQWLKNLLVFVPLVAAHAWDSPAGIQAALLAFVAFSLCASAVYVLNDLVDLEADRRHVRKRNRPFASGLIPIWQGSLMVPVLLAAAFGLASLLPTSFLLVLAFYFCLTLAYSLFLKRRVIVDVLMLAASTPCGSLRAVPPRASSRPSGCSRFRCSSS